MCCVASSVTSARLLAFVPLRAAAPTVSSPVGSPTGASFTITAMPGAVSYTVTPYKNGVAQTNITGLSAGAQTFPLSPDVYYFEVVAVSGAVTIPITRAPLLAASPNVVTVGTPFTPTITSVSNVVSGSSPQLDYIVDPINARIGTTYSGVATNVNSGTTTSFSSITASPFLLTGLGTGVYTVTINATNADGNSQVTSSNFAVGAWALGVLLPLLPALGCCCLAWFLPRGRWCLLPSSVRNSLLNPCYRCPPSRAGLQLLLPPSLLSLARPPVQRSL